MQKTMTTQNESSPLQQFSKLIIRCIYRRLVTRVMSDDKNQIIYICSSISVLNVNADYLNSISQLMIPFLRGINETRINFPSF